MAEARFELYERSSGARLELRRSNAARSHVNRKRRQPRGGAKSVERRAAGGN